MELERIVWTRRYVHTDDFKAGAMIPDRCAATTAE